MKLTPGEIYFIGEREHETGNVTPYYKIGIVRDQEGRTTEERLREHQTGNPRPLFIHSVIKAHAVERVETLMHRKFAQSRGTGEWFNFDDASLSEAINAARQFSDEIAIHIPLIEQAGLLKSVESTDKIIEPGGSTNKWFMAYHSAKSVVQMYGELDGEIRELLKVAVARGERPAGVKQQKIRNTEYFNLARLQQELPELYANYLVENSTLVQRFIVKPATDAQFQQEIEPSVLATAERIRTEIQLVRDEVKTADLLQPLRLVIFENSSNAEWQLEIAEAHLRVATGTNAGIDGITTWKRAYKPKQSFDENAFKGENFELFKAYIDLKQTGGNLLIDAGQAAATQD